MPCSMKRITVHDVAEQAGVPLATVDRVLNRRSGVSGAMSGRVRATIDRLGFQRAHSLPAGAIASSSGCRCSTAAPSSTRHDDLIGIYSIGIFRRDSVS